MSRSCPVTATAPIQHPTAAEEWLDERIKHRPRVLMTNPCFPTANDREAAKRAGVEPPHPADKNEDPAKKARLKNIGGSESDGFNLALAEATRATAWIANEADRAAAVSTVSRGLAAVAPRDELEGMLGAQLVAAHHASMECFRRAMIDGQTAEGRAMNLKHGTKASQTFAALLDTLNRHRGRAPQRVVVEHVHRHVHVHGDGPAIPVAPGGGPGGQIENQRQSHAQALDYQPGLGVEMWGEDPERVPVSRTGDDERQVSDARRDEPGGSEGDG